MSDKEQERTAAVSVDAIDEDDGECAELRIEDATVAREGGASPWEPGFVRLTVGDGSRFSFVIKERALKDALFHYDAQVAGILGPRGASER